jgi:hypothetical protein
MCTTRMYESWGFVGSVPNTAMVCVTSEGGNLSSCFFLDSVLRDSWEYNGVVVPVSTKRWAGNILHTALDIYASPKASWRQRGGFCWV